MNPDELSLQLDGLREQLASDPQAAGQLQEIVQELSQEMLPAELIEELINMFYQALTEPESYPRMVQELQQSGVLDAEDFPPQYDEGFLMVFLSALDLIRDNMDDPEEGGGLAQYQSGMMEDESAEAQMGRGGDSMTAHINPIEARMLQRNGGRGSVNPATGMPEFGFFKKLKKLFKKVARIAIPMAAMYFGVPALGAAFGGGALGSGLAGGLIGGGLSAAQGGKFFGKGMALGALGGAFSGGMGGAEAASGSPSFGDMGSGSYGLNPGFSGGSFMDIPGGFDLGSGLTPAAGNAFGGVSSLANSAGAVASGIGSAADSFGSIGELTDSLGTQVDPFATSASTNVGWNPESGYGPQFDNYADASTQDTAWKSLGRDVSGTLNQNPELGQAYNAYKQLNQVRGLYNQMNPPEAEQPAPVTQRLSQSPNGNRSLVQSSMPPPRWASNFNGALGSFGGALRGA